MSHLAQLRSAPAKHPQAPPGGPGELMARAARHLTAPLACPLPRALGRPCGCAGALARACFLCYLAWAK